MEDGTPRTAGIGTYLIGGYFSVIEWNPLNSTLIKDDGTQEPGFPIREVVKNAHLQ